MPSNQKKVIILHYRAWILWSGIGLFILAIATFIILAFYSLDKFSLPRLFAIQSEYDFLFEENDALKKKLSNVQQTAANCEVVSQLEKSAAINLKNTITTLEKENATLSDDIVFYDRLMNPENVRTGIDFLPPVLIPYQQDNTFFYRLVVFQLRDRYRRISGKMSIDIIGEKEGKNLSLPLHKLSETVSKNIKLSFVYYQEIEGIILLPPGFKPYTIRLRAQMRDKRKSKRDKIYQWKVKSV